MAEHPGMIVLDTIEIEGRTIEVAVGKSGMFATYMEDATQAIARGEKLESVIESTKQKLRATRKRVAIKFYDLDGTEGLAYSVHAGNGAPLVSIEGERKQWIGGFHDRATALSGDTPQEAIARLREIEEEISERKIERDEIIERFGVNLRHVVAAAMLAANTEEGES